MYPPLLAMPVGALDALLSSALLAYTYRNYTIITLIAHELSLTALYLSSRVAMCGVHCMCVYVVSR